VSLFRRQLLASKHMCQLRAVRQANAQVLALITQIGRRRHASSQPDGVDAPKSFVAGDSRRGTAAMFVPPAFAELTAQLAEITSAALGFDEAARRTIEVEGWPPPASACRTRVVLGGEGGFLCQRCERSFSKLWASRVDGGGARALRGCLCWECEGALRAEGVCPFDVVAAGRAAHGAKGSAKGGAKGSAKGGAKGGSDEGSSGGGFDGNGGASSHRAFFCVHQRKCVVCDGASYEACEVCRMAQGDGEAVAALSAHYLHTSALSPALFLDFDRTLATTRSGGSPLQGAHAVDPELAEVAASVPMTWVITRNRHVDEITSFLVAKGVRVAGVTHVRKGQSKADAMLNAMPSLRETSPNTTRAIFVDDDVRECCDPKVAAIPGLMRVLFRRGTV